MNLKFHFVVLFAVTFLFAPLMRAQDDPLKDPDLQDALKQAQEMQKESGPAKPAKMSDLKKQADEIEAQQKQDEQKEKAALQKRLDKQLAAPGKPLNHVYNNGHSNGSVTTRLFVSTRTDPVQKVQLEASRDSGEKITHVNISSPLLMPDGASE